MASHKSRTTVGARRLDKLDRHFHYFALSIEMTLWDWWPSVGHFLHTAGPRILNATVARKKKRGRDHFCGLSTNQHSGTRCLRSVHSWVQSIESVRTQHACNLYFLSLSHIIPLPSLMHSSCISPLFLLIMGYGNDDLNARTSNIQNAQCKMPVQENNLLIYSIFI